MFGYTITVNGTTPAKRGDICYKNIVCSNHFIDKFQKDKIFTETEDYIILLDGVILNRVELIEKCNVINNDNQWLNTIIQLYRENGEMFFNVLRGSFSGALYDKSSDNWIIFGDQIGSKYTFYAKEGEFFCCGEEMGYMYKLLKENNFVYHLSTENTLLLLSYGFMLDDRTLCKEVHRIKPGCYLTLKDGILLEHRYYMLNNLSDYGINENDAIELIDKYFRQAVIRQFEKDNEYGYQHIVSLSGGLDCRMTTFVAHDCGYTKQTNITFSQTDYWDQILPMRMSAALKHEWIFKALDNGIWLYDVDDISQSTGGNVLYYGSAHGNSLLKYLNFEHLGLLHSGQIGDVVIGSFVNAKDKDDEYRLGDGAYSTKYLSKIKDLPLALSVKKELGMLYYRGFQGANNGLQNLYNYTETLSPFLDIDVLENILKIPVEFRQNHRIYIKWILNKYPQAAKYEWETTGKKITEKTICIGGRETPITNIPKKLYFRIASSLGIPLENYRKKNMNPLGYYLHTNNELRNYLWDYFKYIDAIKDEELRQIIIDIKDNGTAYEKIEAISLLGAIKLFYC